MRRVFYATGRSQSLIAEYANELKWQQLPLMQRCKRIQVENGEVTILKCGDGTLHPVESGFVKREVHSLMQVDRPVVSPEQLDRVVLWVDKPLTELRGTR